MGHDIVRKKQIKFKQFQFYFNQIFGGHWRSSAFLKMSLVEVVPAYYEQKKRVKEGRLDWMIPSVFCEQRTPQTARGQIPSVGHGHYFRRILLPTSSISDGVPRNFTFWLKTEESMV